jgi:hypothetical protein
MGPEGMCLWREWIQLDKVVEQLAKPTVMKVPQGGP